jgi:PadR family transcriptional regulator, regulatory protein AphA
MKPGSSSSKFALLGVLSLKPSSGYDIKQSVKGSIGHFWNESYGRIYPLLKELAKEGLIVQQRGKTSGRPERQVYSITPRGETALGQWLKQSPRNEPARSELLLKLFFADRIQPELSAQHVREKKQLEQAKLAVYRQAEESIRQHYPTHPGLPYWLMTISFGRHMAQSLVAWCDETLETLSELNRKAKKKRGTA